ncbi:MAG TPA: hypothetical protein VFP61_07615 [Acidimicrobiales bacterium]|nr:hypothetical protein [Acidimicrobiales bacterium]
MFWTDETFWIALGSLVAAVLTTAGLGNLATPVQTAIDAVAGLVSAVYVAAAAHQRAATATAAAVATTAATNASAATAGPAVSGDQVALLLERAASALRTATTSPTTAVPASAAAVTGGQA